MDDRSLAHLEDSLQQAGRMLAYPAMPDLAAAALRPQTAPRRPRPALRLAWAAAAVLALAASLLAVPDVRARVLEFLQVGGVHINLPAEGVSKFISTKRLAKALEQYGEIVPLADLQGIVSLAQARREAGFEIALPNYPTGLGEPDRVYLQGDDGERYAILVWMAPDDAKVDMAVYILGPGVQLSKTQPDAVERLWVHDSLGALVVGNHFLQTHAGTSAGVLVQAPALIWQLGELTYRLEANRPVPELLRIAESID
ncbi:MAG: hypothetical protein KF701_07190 [Anaerolineales bacterium]|nr:MAG: hypothetical protein KF701_07190 [Anaerolineales bacterium]